MNHSYGWFKVRRIRIFLKQGIRRVHYFELSSSKIQYPTSRMFIHYNDEHKIKLETTNIIIIIIIIMNHHEAWFMINIKRWQQQKTNDFHCRNQIYHFECWFHAVFMSNKIWYHFLCCWNNRKVFKQYKNVLKLNNMKKMF